MADTPAEPADEGDLAELDATVATPAPEDAPHIAAAQETAATDAQADLDEVARANSSSADGGGLSEPGAPIQERPAPAALNVSNSTPSQALTQVSQLPPAQLLSSLGSVSAAVDNDAAQANQRLVANPPQRVRASGAPATLPAPGFAAPLSADRSLPNAVKPAAAAEASIGRPPDLPHLPEAVAPSGQLATHDPALAVTVGPLPHFPAAGNADPTAVQQHQQA
ncbi:MAG TPA: hypothetical protein VIT43_03690, partial [Candidatus Dormibacteraeota bacterium]